MASPRPGSAVLVCWLLGVCASVAILALAVPAKAQSGSAYTIADFPVEARAKNAVAAKQAAVSDGQSAAFNSLLKRIVPVTAYGRLRQLGDVDAVGYLEGITVKEERNSSTEYLATYDFRFSADSVRGLLRERGVPFIDQQAPPVTLVPIAVGPERSPLASPGAWGEVWRVLDLKNALTPVRLQQARRSVSREVLEGLAQGGAGGSYSQISADYGGGPVAVASAHLDAGAKKLNVRIDGRDAVGPIAWARSYRVYDGDSAYAMELAAVVTLGVLEGRWKAARAQQLGGVAALAQPVQPVRAEVLFGSARDWYAMQRTITQLPEVGGFQVLAVSARRADVALNYPGGGAALANALARQGVSMTIAGDRWIVQQKF